MIRQLTLGINSLVWQTAIGHLIPLKPLLTLRLGNHSAAGNICQKTFTRGNGKSRLQFHLNPCCHCDWAFARSAKSIAGIGQMRKVLPPDLWVRHAFKFSISLSNILGPLRPSPSRLHKALERGARATDNLLLATSCASFILTRHEKHQVNRMVYLFVSISDPNSHATMHLIGRCFEQVREKRIGAIHVYV